MALRQVLMIGVLLLAPACGQATTPGHDSQPTASAASENQSATPASLFAERAAMFENFEIQAAQIAQQHAHSPAAKGYAAASLAEHQVTLQQLSGAVQAADMPTPSSALSENYNAYLDMLRHANAQNFDTTYTSQQALAYMTTAGLYDSFTSTAPDSPLKQWAQGQSQRIHDGVAAARQLATAIISGR